MASAPAPDPGVSQVEVERQKLGGTHQIIGWLWIGGAQISGVPNLPFLDPSIESNASIPFLESSGTIDHGSLSGLADDDHTQYYNQQRGDARYEQAANRNIANGYAGLGADGKIALSQLPDANALESEAIAFAIALG